VRKVGVDAVRRARVKAREADAIVRMVMVVVLSFVPSETFPQARSKLQSSDRSLLQLPVNARGAKGQLSKRVKSVKNTRQHL
jgi:hypothetical protein